MLIFYVTGGVGNNWLRVGSTSLSVNQSKTCMVTCLFMLDKHNVATMWPDCSPPGKGHEFIELMYTSI